MNQDRFGFRDFFTYVIPGSLYVLATIIWFPDYFKKALELNVALLSLGFIIISYTIGFVTYLFTYFFRLILPGWQEETEDTIKMIIVIIHKMPEFYQSEISRYRNLCRVCLSLSFPSFLLGFSLTIMFWTTATRYSVWTVIFTIIITCSLLYRSLRYNKRYIKQIQLAYDVACKKR